MYHIFYTHYSVNGHLGYFHVLYTKQCCNVHQSAGILSNYGFLSIYVEEWDYWVTESIFSLSRNLYTVFCFPGGSDGKETTCNVGDLGSVPGLGRSPGEGKGYPLQYSGLENSMDCLVHGVPKSRTRLRAFTSFHTALCSPGGSDDKK